MIMEHAYSRRWWTLGAISLALLAATMDATVLTLALPTLAGAFKASESQLQWFVTAYTLALVAGMLPAGLAADRYGRKRLMVGALVVFCLGSVACAYSRGPAEFIVARVVLGAAAAAMTVVALSLLTVLFDEKERPRAVGIWGAANFIGLPLGPIVGGWILSHFWWGWIFLMNVPVALIGLAAVLFLVPESKADNAPLIDFIGLALSSLGLIALMYGVIQSGSAGWGSVSAIVPVVAGLSALALFATWERHMRAAGHQPLVDLELFGSPSFTWGVVLTAFGALALFGVLFALPQFFEAILGQSAQGAGVHLLPLIGGLIVGAIPADRLASRLGTKITVAVGFALVMAGTALGSTMTGASSGTFVALWTFLTGVGAGIGFTTAASAALVELSAERSGVGSALLQAVIKLGPAFGSSVLGSILTATYQGHLDTRGLAPAVAVAAKSSVFSALAAAHEIGSAALAASARAAFVQGMDASATLAAAIAAAALLLALAFLPSIRPAQRKDSEAA
jgi:MFS transporter, DHA2 family, multidrug resistance protein